MTSPVPNKPTVFSFHGRIGRQKLWLSWIAFILLNAACNVVIRHSNGDASTRFFLDLFQVPFAIWLLLAPQIKRWHDRDKSGWMTLINFIPIVGQLWTMIELGFLRGTVGQNSFGEDPLLASIPRITSG